MSAAVRVSECYEKQRGQLVIGDESQAPAIGFKKDHRSRRCSQLPRSVFVPFSSPPETQPKDEITMKTRPIHISTLRGEERQMGEGPREADSLVVGQANVFDGMNLASRNGDSPVKDQNGSPDASLDICRTHRGKSTSIFTPRSLNDPLSPLSGFPFLPVTISG